MSAYLHLIDQRRLIGPGGSTVSGNIYFYYTDTNVLAPVYQDPGLSIPSVNPISVAAGAVVPNLYLDSNITYKRRIVYSDGTVDEQDPLGFLFSGDALGIPVGTIIDYPGPNIPANYLLCAGQEVSRTTYAALFGALGTTYGAGNGTTTFNLPDYRGRVSAGKDNMNGTAANRLISIITGSTLGATGGTEEVTLTEAQMPSHNHTLTDPGHSHIIDNPVIDTTGSLSAPPGGGLGIRATYNTRSNTTGISIADAGADAAHSNVQPTIVVNKIIKAMDTTALSLIDLIPSFNIKANALAIGISATDNDMGIFSGNIIPDGVTAKTALQDLSNAIESIVATTSGVLITGFSSSLLAGGSYGLRTDLGDLSPILPAISSVVPGTFIDVQDASYSAATNNQTINAHAGDSITYQDFAPSSTFVMTVNGVCFRFRSDGTTWRVVYYGQ